MNLIVWNVGKEMPSKYTSGMNTRVAFKSLDKEDKKTYYLNLDSSFTGISKWYEHVKEGNILDVQVHDGGTAIDKFKNFTVIKTVGKEI